MTSKVLVGNFTVDRDELRVKIEQLGFTLGTFDSQVKFGMKRNCIIHSLSCFKSVSCHHY